MMTHRLSGSPLLDRY